MVKSWLVNSISKDIASTILFMDTTAKIWKDLYNRFAHNNRPSIFQLRKDISTIAQGHNYVNIFYSQLKCLCDELLTLKPIPICGCEPVRTYCSSKLLIENQEEQVSQFLMGLNDSYSQFREQIMLIEPFPSISKILSLPLQEEKQIGILISNA